MIRSIVFSTSFIIAVSSELIPMQIPDAEKLYPEYFGGHKGEVDCFRAGQVGSSFWECVNAVDYDSEESQNPGLLLESAESQDAIEWPIFHESIDWQLRGITHTETF